MLLIEDAERVRTFQLRNCQPDRFQKITRIVLLQQMCDHLCIGFRGEDTALRLQLCLQCRIIFDNPIVYNRKFSRAAAVRMRIRIRRLAMRRPPGVPNPNSAKKAAPTLYLIRENFQPALRFCNFDLPILQDGDPC